MAACLRRAPFAMLGHRLGDCAGATGSISARVRSGDSGMVLVKGPAAVLDQIGGDPVVDRDEAATHGIHGRDHRKRDHGGDKAIFDCGSAQLIFGIAREEMLHVRRLGRDNRSIRNVSATVIKNDYTNIIKPHLNAERHLEVGGIFYWEFELFEATVS